MNGVPNVPNAALPAEIGLAAVDQNVVASLLGTTPQWGLFFNGQPAIVADSCIGVEYRDPSKIPTYPIEQGAFGTYNKVQRPFQGRVRYRTGGSQQDRQALIASAQAAQFSLTLFELRQPEVVYQNVNVYEIQYERHDGDSGWLIVDLLCEEIRPTVTTAYSTPNGGKTITNAVDPGANNPTATGTVQTQPPSQAQSSAIDAGFL